MKRTYAGKIRLGMLTGALCLTLVGCGGATSTTGATSSQSAESKSTASTETVHASTTNGASDGILNTAEFFTDRDLEQTAATDGATAITVQSGQDVDITKEGLYVLSGDATDVTIRVNVDSSAKVQLVLDGLTIQNTDSAAIYVVSADKVFITTVAGSTNNLSVSGSFVADGDTNVDAVVFSKDDLVLNGLGTLVINSTQNGISSHDDIKVTGGTYQIDCKADAIEANDDVLVADGTFTITAGKDAIHAENDEDVTKGNVYIAGGSSTIQATGDGIQAQNAVQIDGGVHSINAGEAIEATYIQINDGKLAISAKDDGINASAKSSAYTPTIEIRGGDITIQMASGDTDALDSNGNLYISGGSTDISAQFAFDFDGQASLTGGTVYVNGEQVTSIENAMMGGGGAMGGGAMGGRGAMGGGLNR